MVRKKADDLIAAVEDVLEKAAPTEEVAETVLGEKIKKGLKGKPEFDTSFLDIATRLVAAGFTEKDLGYVFGVPLRKIQGWKRRSPLFKMACEGGKKLARSYLVARGLRAAAGYDYVEVNVKYKTKVDKKTGELVRYKSEESEFRKHQKPDGNLLQFLLVNISRHLKDDEPFTSQHKIEIEENKKIAITLTGKAAEQQIAKLAGAFMPQAVFEAELEEKPKKRRKIKSETKDA